MKNFFSILFLLTFVSKTIFAEEIFKNIQLSKTNNEKTNNFIILKIGGGISGFMNNISFSELNTYNKYTDNIPIVANISNIFKNNLNFNICDIGSNIKKHGFSYLASNYNLTIDLMFNKQVIKCFYFTFGISGRLENKIITHKYLQNLRIFLNEFNTVKNNIESNDDDNQMLNGNNEEINKILKENNFEVKNEEEKFDILHNTTANIYNVYTLKFLKIGGIAGTSFFFNKNNLRKSLFIGIYFFIRYRKLLSINLENKNRKEFLELNNNVLRINPFDISLGFEFGKCNNLSVLFELGITSMLQKISKLNHNNTERIYQKNRIKLFDINISIRYNKL